MSDVWKRRSPLEHVRSMEGLGRLCCQSTLEEATSCTNSRHLDIVPLGILQDHAIAIVVFVCLALEFPVRIERGTPV